MDWASPGIAKKYKVTLQNTPRYSTESVAETILAEVLLHSRQRLLAFRDAIAGRDIQAREGFNLLGRKAGVIGYGSIGSRVAELLKAVGMHVRIWNRSPKPGIELSSLKSIFAECDVICLCVATELAGTAANKGFIDSELLQLCSNAILINLASEHLVELGSLQAALKSGKIKGYSVERSKNMLASPLASIENVHLPPSNSWKSPESLQTLRDIWVANTISALRDKPENVFHA
jgi:phosphoglycerate dehydrogenase-like enzyme